MPAGPAASLGPVPCHLDYGPRNWLTEAGTLYVIDFEWAQLEASVDDLTRLHYGLWNNHPHLQEAFLDGYGRTLTPDDHQVLRACGALRAVWLVVRGHHYGETDLVDANRQTLRCLMNEAKDKLTEPSGLQSRRAQPAFQHLPGRTAAVQGAART